jgi:hypothetical protein
MPMVYTAFAQMPWTLLDLKRHLDLIAASELLMSERSGDYDATNINPKPGFQSSPGDPIELTPTRRVPALC